MSHGDTMWWHDWLECTKVWSGTILARIFPSPTSSLQECKVFKLSNNLLYLEQHGVENECSHCCERKALTSACPWWKTVGPETKEILLQHYSHIRKLKPRVNRSIWVPKRRRQLRSCWSFFTLYLVRHHSVWSHMPWSGGNLKVHILVEVLLLRN